MESNIGCGVGLCFGKMAIWRNTNKATINRRGESNNSLMAKEASGKCIIAARRQRQHE